MIRKVAVVVLVSALLGIGLGLTPRLMAGKRRGRPVQPTATAPAREPTLAEMGFDQRGEWYRHTVIPTEITSPGPGLIRIDGAYRVGLSAPWDESMAVHLEVTDLATGEEVWSRELMRRHFGRTDRGHFPIELDIPVPPGRYLVHLYVHQLADMSAEPGASRATNAHSGIRAGVVVQ